MIHGNLEGIRESYLRELETLYEASFDRDLFLPEELLHVLVRFTELINREMLVYLGRDGSVLRSPSAPSAPLHCRSCTCAAIWIA